MLDNYMQLKSRGDELRQTQKEQQLEVPESAARIYIHDDPFQIESEKLQSLGWNHD